MHTFQYKRGDRPLDGFTIERAAGRGGFGEVYYAVSDAGRQVALKAVLGHEQIELRGIGHCMNLKSPHLVTIFDVRHNAAGRPFVVMEYVAGPSLRQLLDASPAGLGEQKAAFFLREMGKGLTDLHENGIVHRDLKPANVFFEDGRVKIGDYGLAKLIDAGHDGGQTATVGTVHYMAPEVGAGRYDRGVDIYALGVVLYELLTGTVPFTGGSAGEVLIKHLSRDVDTSALSEPFATVVGRALAKDPARRYGSVREMVEAVFGSDHVQQGMSGFSPADLSVVAARATAAAAAGRPAAPRPIPIAAAVAGDGWDDLGERIGREIEQKVAKITDRTQRRISRLADRTQRKVDRVNRRFGGDAGPFAPASSHTLSVGPAAATAADPLSCGHRFRLAALAACVAGIAAAALRHGSPGEGAVAFLSVATAVAAGTWTLRLALRSPAPRLHAESDFVARLAVGGPAAAAAAACSCVIPVGLNAHGSLLGLCAGIAAPLLFMDVAAWGDPHRDERVAFWGKVFLAFLFASIVAGVLGGSGHVAGITVGGIALATQLLCPWVRRPARPVEADPVDPAGAAPPTAGDPPAPATAPAPAPSAAAAGVAPPLVPGLARTGWLAASLAAFSLGLSMLILTGAEADPPLPLLVCGGVGLVAASVVCFVQSFRRRFWGWWNYAGRPLAILAGIGWVCFFSALLAHDRLSRSGQLGAVFMVVLGSSAAVTALSIPGRWTPPAAGPARPVPPAPPFPPVPPIPWATVGDALRRSARSVARRHRRADRRRWPDGRAVTTRLAGLLTGVLLVAAVAAALAVTANVPEAMSLGLPDPAAIRRLTDGPFADYPAWPDLLLRLGKAAAVACTAAGVCATMLVRRDRGPLHLLRGVVGLPLLVAAAALAGSAFHPGGWAAVADRVHAHRSQAAVTAVVLDGLDDRRLAAAAATWMASMALVAWPARRRPDPVPATPVGANP